MYIKIFISLIAKKTNFKINNNFSFLSKLTNKYIITKIKLILTKNIYEFTKNILRFIRKYSLLFDNL